MEKVKNVVICGAGMMGNMIGLVFSSCPDFNITIWNRREKPCKEVIQAALEQLRDKESVRRTGRHLPRRLHLRNKHFRYEPDRDCFQMCA